MVKTLERNRPDDRRLAQVGKKSVNIPYGLGMTTKGCGIEFVAVPVSWRQLEQCRQRWAGRVELEQRSHEHEHEHRVSPRFRTKVSRARSSGVMASVPAPDRKDTTSSAIWAKPSNSEKPLADCVWYLKGSPSSAPHFEGAQT